MKNKILFPLLILLASIMTSCSSDSDTSGDDPKTNLLQLGKISTDRWTYVSLANNKVIGTSIFGSAAEDSIWHNRTDWDIALCGQYMRTNSGTSGKGKGGAAKIIGKTYETLKAIPSDSIKTDSIIIQ